MNLPFKFILYFLYDVKKKTILLTTFVPSILNFFGREGDPWNLDIYRVQTLLAPPSTWYNLILSTPHHFQSPHQTQSQIVPSQKSAGKRKKAKKIKI
jgi:hypothetical protein